MDYLDEVIKELRSLSREELIAEMEKHRNSDIACALRELNECDESEHEQGA